MKMVAFGDNAPADLFRRFAEKSEIRRRSDVNGVTEQMIGNKDTALDLFGDSVAHRFDSFFTIVLVGVIRR